MNILAPLLSGAISLAALIAALFFLRFWTRTRDSFFLLFAAAFMVEAASRFLLAFVPSSNEAEPFYYLPRLLAFGLILLAVVLKNLRQR